jgi:hypothetical protein
MKLSLGNNFMDEFYNYGLMAFPYSLFRMRILDTNPRCESSMRILDANPANHSYKASKATATIVDELPIFSHSQPTDRHRPVGCVVHSLWTLGTLI